MKKPIADLLTSWYGINFNFCSLATQDVIETRNGDPIHRGAQGTLPRGFEPRRDHEAQHGLVVPAREIPAGIQIQIWRHSLQLHVRSAIVSRPKYLSLSIFRSLQQPINISDRRRSSASYNFALFVSWSGSTTTLLSTGRDF